MVNTSGIARLGMLAIGLGIGAASAHAPVASADASTDWSSSIDSLLGGALPAADPSGLDLAISFDGYSLFSDGSAVADTGAAGNGSFDFAIAYGDGATATATGGNFDFASADGINALAAAGGYSGSTGDDFDTAIDIGNNPDDKFDNGAFAGAGNLAYHNDPGLGSGSYDTAINIGNDGVDTQNDGAFAGAGGLIGLGGDGDHDTAINFGNDSGIGDGADAVDGSNNSASYFGNISGFGESAYAAHGDNDIASVVGSGTAYSGGTFDPAVVGNNDIATVFDPFGTAGGYSVAGADDMLNLPGNFDIAAAFGDGFSPEATGANYLVEILPTLF
jgi:hypothetical protein